MGPPGSFLGSGVLRLSHRAALKPARKHLDRLGERVHPGLESAQPFSRSRRDGIKLWLTHGRQALPPRCGRPGSFVTRQVL